MQLPRNTWRWRNLLVVALVLASGVLLPRTAFARIIDVRAGEPLPAGWFFSISDALAQVDPNANPPDVINVHKPISGLTSYNESVVITKPVRLVAVPSAEDPGPVIIEGNGGRTILVQGSPEKPLNVLISGFTIRDGDASFAASSPGNGGGVALINATGLIENNIIENNKASTGLAQSGFGGGVYIQGGSPVLRGNTIQNNVANQNASDQYVGFGGGVRIVQSAARLENNIIQNNRAVSGGSAAFGYGGGVYISDDAALPLPPVLANNTISGNIGGDSGFNGSGGGVFMQNSSATLVGNTITNNLGGSLGDCFGGGVAIYGVLSSPPATAPVLQDNLIQANRAGSEVARRGHGGGVAVVTAPAYLLHNQITGNTGGGAQLGIGGGVYINTTPQNRAVWLEANTVIGNRAPLSGNAGQAGAIYTYAATVKATNNVIAKNVAATESGAFVSDFGAITLLNNTIADNAAAGMIARAGTVMTATNTIISGHERGVVAQTSGGSPSTVRLSHTLFHANTSDTQAELGNTIENTQAFVGAGTDPSYRNPAAATPDYRIGPNSKARDRGLAGVPLDADMRPRLGLPDLGAYEYRVDLAVPIVRR